MANVTYYVVLAFVHDADGELIAEEGAEAPSAHSALSRARAMIGKKGRSHRVQPIRVMRKLGDFNDAVILGHFGEVPSDLLSFTGAG